MAGYQIAPIQRLRAAAALLVVVGHAQNEAIVSAGRHGVTFRPLTILPWGAGVDLFFVISGFIMVVASEQLFARPDAPRVFLTRRLKRIVPLYWLFTTLYIAAQFAARKHVDLAAVATSYLFVPRDNFADGIARPIYTLGWTLNYEMFFYALFALAIRWPMRRAVGIVTVVLGLGVVAGQLWALPAGPLAFWTEPIVLEFAFGMWLGLAWRAGFALRREHRLAVFAVGLAMLAFDLMGAAHQASSWITPTDLRRVIGWGIPSALLVAAAVLSSRAVKAEPATGGWLVALGDASYALYLVHPFVVGLLARAWQTAGLGASPLSWAGFVVAALVLSIAAGNAVHRSIENPLARLMAVRLNRAAISARRPTIA